MAWNKRVVILVVLLMLGMAGCGSEVVEEEAIIRPVRYTKAVLSEGVRSRTFSGAARSSLDSNLSFRVPGMVSLMKVAVGDQVQKGDLIARMDAKDYRLQVQAAEAGLQQAKAQALHADSSYERVGKLYENDNVSKSDLDQARAAYDSSRAMVRSIEKKLELARSQLGYTEIRAPFSGAVSVVRVDENETVPAGSPVVVLESESAPEVVLAIPDVLISSIKEGSGVTVKFYAISGREFSGKVTEVGFATTSFATTYPVTVALDERERLVRPGMSADVTFTFSEERKPVIIVPSHAVDEDGNGRYVYVARPGKDEFATVKRIEVVTGDLVTEGIEIIKGLSEGDLVVTAGISRLQDEMTVRLIQ